MPDLFADAPSPHPPDAAGGASSGAPSDAERRAVVALSLVPGVGPTRVRALLAAFGSASAVLSAPASRLAAVDGVGRATARAIAGFDPGAQVDEQFRAAERVGAALLAAADDGYPPALREIYDPPPALWVRGRLDDADAVAVAIVGTRKAGDYGRRAAEHFATSFAHAGVTVVSGLAYGIDVAAHRAALAAGGRTVAVLGSGVDRVYPARHGDVVRGILDNDLGAVVSEFPMGAAPDATNFPRRNRIISGMSRATVVAEAREKGGALLTAAIALEQNREVFAVPVPIFGDALGTNRLVQRGWAALANAPADVLAAVGQPFGGAPGPDLAPLPDDLSRIERRLLGALGAVPVTLDAVCAEARVDPPEALVYLLQLEFRGLVRQLAGKQFARV